MKWIKKDLDSREQHLYDLLIRIRLSLLTKEYLENVVCKENLIRSSEKCLSLCTRAIQCYADPTIRLYVNSLPRKCKTDEFGLIYVVGPILIEMFDMVTGRWYWCLDIDLKELIGPISTYVCVPLNKKIYFIQPFDGHIEIYNLLNKSFEHKACTDEQLEFSGINSACVFENWIYFFGGMSSNDKTKFVLRYNVTEHKWEEVTPVSIDRNMMAVVTLNGYIYVMGGRLNNGDLTNSVSGLTIFLYSNVIYKFWNMHIR